MRNKKVYPTKYYIRFLTFIVFTVFTLFYRIKKRLPKKVRQLKSPYLLLSNHVGFWDPFLIGHFLPKFTHFVSSDAAFRNPLLRFFLTRLGTIPKKKNIRDTKVIRDIIALIRQGENVGIFPEAVRNWAGVSQPMDKSIAKLIKLLEVPVVIAVLKGMNLFNPRWSTKIRRTKVEVEYKVLLDKRQIDHFSENEIFDMLKSGIYHDEVEYQKEQMNKVYSKQRAEYINHAIYICPECKTIDNFMAENNGFACTECTYDIFINKYGFYERKNQGSLHFDNMRDWFNWQEGYLYKYVQAKFDENSEQVIFEDKASHIFHSKTNTTLYFIGLADIKLSINRIEIAFIDKNKIIILNFNDLQTINPQVKERLEIYYNNEAYRIIGGRNGVSALKWEVAMNAIWKKLGQVNKLSPYISSNFI